MLALLLIVFFISMSIYISNSAQTAQLSDKLEANALCLQVANSLNSLSAVSGESIYAFNLPKKISSKNYSVYVASESRAVRVDYNGSGVGCRIHVLNVTNSTGASFFELEKNASVTGSGGVLVVYP